MRMISSDCTSVNNIIKRLRPPYKFSFRRVVDFTLITGRVISLLRHKIGVDRFPMIVSTIILMIRFAFMISRQLIAEGSDMSLLSTVMIGDYSFSVEM